MTPEEIVLAAAALAQEDERDARSQKRLHRPEWTVPATPWELVLVTGDHLDGTPWPGYRIWGTPKDGQRRGTTDIVILWDEHIEFGEILVELANSGEPSLVKLAGDFVTAYRARKHHGWRVIAAWHNVKKQREGKGDTHADTDTAAPVGA